MPTQATTTQAEADAVRLERIARERHQAGDSPADAAQRPMTEDELEAWWDKLEAAGEGH